MDKSAKLRYRIECFMFSGNKMFFNGQKQYWGLKKISMVITWVLEPTILYFITTWATSLSLLTFIHWRRKWQPTPVFLPGKSHRQRSLVGYRPQGCKESDTNEKLNYHHSLTNFMKLILSKLRTVGTAQSQMTVSVSNSILMSNIL